MRGPSGFPTRPLPWVLAGLTAIGLATGFLGCQRERENSLAEYRNATRPELRAKALAKLGELGHEEDFPLFLKAAREQSAIIREEAARALGRSEDTRAIDTLGELLADPDPEVQAIAAAGLARFNTDKSRAYLLNAFGRQDAPARKAIAAAIGAPALGEAVRHEAKVLWERNLKALESGGPAERIGAAEELGRSGRGDAVERLLPLLGDDSVLLAAAAVRGVGAAHDKRALPALLGVVKENYPMLREAAAEALGSLGDPAAVPALDKMARDGGPSAIAAVRALGRLSSAEAAQQALCELAAEASHDVAVASARLANGRCPVEPILSRLSRGGSETLAALAVLAVTGGAEGAAKVTAQLDSSDEQIRVGAAHALASLQAPEAEPKVLRMLSAEAARLARSRQKWIAGPLPLVEAETDDHGHKHEDEAGLPPQLASYLAAERERKESFKAMLERVDTLKAARAEAQGIRIVDREEKTPLEVMDDVHEDELRLLIALERAAGALGSQGAVPILEQLASDPVVAIRAAACGALARTGIQGVERAGACLLDRSLEVVREAARGLVLAGPAAAPVLQKALAERGADRSEIIRALGELKATAAAPDIAKLLEVGGLESVEAAVALGKLGDRAHVGALVKQLGDRTSVARLEIIEALGALGDPSAAEALTGELFSERPDIRAAAARALGKVGAGAKTEALSALRFDYYAEVRRAAEEVLGPEGGGP